MEHDVLVCWGMWMRYWVGGCIVESIGTNLSGKAELVDVAVIEVGLGGRIDSTNVKRCFLAFPVSQLHEAYKVLKDKASCETYVNAGLAIMLSSTWLQRIGHPEFKSIDQTSQYVIWFLSYVLGAHSPGKYGKFVRTWLVPQQEYVHCVGGNLDSEQRGTCLGRFKGHREGDVVQESINVQEGGVVAQESVDVQKEGIVGQESVDIQKEGGVALESVDVQEEGVVAQESVEVQEEGESSSEDDEELL
ncbi:folylpolyglutamate synthase isoform X8 [Tanacetum coccineum]